MRVAVVCPYSVSIPGGVQTQAVGQVRALRAMGHDAVLLAPADTPVDASLLAGGTFVALGRTVGVPANGSVAPLALTPAALVRAARSVRRDAFDVVHLHEPLAPGPNYACLLAARVPLVGTFHRAGWSAAYRWLAPVARAGASRLTVRCAVSDAAAATARRALGGDYEVVANGVDVERYDRADPWPSTGPTVLFVGRHEQRKGLGVLLDAWASADRGSAMLWVAGDGPDTASLQARHPSGPGLQWIGRIDDDDKARRMRGADVVCVPSLRGESFGVVLLEAMAARAAVVASDLPGYASVVDGHATLVPPGDVAALAFALGAAVADAAAGTGRCDPEALADAARLAGRWSMAAMAGRYDTIYQRLLGR